MLLEYQVVRLREYEALRCLRVYFDEVDAQKVQLCQAIEVEVLEHNHIDTLPDLLHVGKCPQRVVDAVIL